MKCRKPVLKYTDTLLKAIASLLPVCRVVIVSKLATVVNISVFPSKYQQETLWNLQKTLRENIWILTFENSAMQHYSHNVTFRVFFPQKEKKKLCKNSSEVFTFFFFFCESEVVKAVITVDVADNDSSMVAAERQIDFSVDIPAPVNTTDVHRCAHLRILNTARLSLKAADSFVFTAVWERLDQFHADDCLRFDTCRYGQRMAC